MDTTNSKRITPQLCFVLLLAAVAVQDYSVCLAFPTGTRSSFPTPPLFLRTQLSASTSSSLLLTDSVYDTIHNGGIAVIDNFLTPETTRRLRQDAQALHQDGHFITDSLAGYSAKKMQQDKQLFDASKDRAVCPAYIPSQNYKRGPFLDSNLGDYEARQSLCREVSNLRGVLAAGLDRPGMDAASTVVRNRHEISMTRYGPGAYLKRHTDEHHEELKGVAGWSKPTRRSLSWLVYLNEADWKADADGGNLRTFPRVAVPPSHRVGSRQGDLQIGWLSPTPKDRVERPVFLDGRRQGESGHCALYIDAEGLTNTINDNNPQNGGRLYLTKNFQSDPYLFLSTDWVVQHVLIGNSELGNRFHYVEPPKSLLTDYWAKLEGETNNKSGAGERILDVPPTGGTLVMFDSVALPHQVMPTQQRERWAISGWFHEAQQDIPLRQQQQQLFV